MKAVIFAGGVGTRLWPLSRKKSPKQFEKIVGDKSTLQLTIELLKPELKPEDIYIATGKEYVALVQNQLHELPAANVIGEPMRRDVGPAVAFWMGYLSKKFPNEPVIILWSDHQMRDAAKFKKILQSSDKLLQKYPEKVIYIGHTPRFASENLGWLETGNVKAKVEEVEFKEFVGLKYRPSKDVAEKYLQSKNYCWNLGTFITTPAFFYNLFARFAPKIHELVEKILEAEGSTKFNEVFAKNYSQMPEINLDNAISEQLDHQFAYVAVDNLEWSDLGAWEALKEALEETKSDNVTRGQVLLKESQDNLIYNYDSKKLIVGIDLEDMLVVDTGDVLLVTRKSSVPKVKKLVESFEGTENEHLT